MRIALAVSFLVLVLAAPAHAGYGATQRSPIMRSPSIVDGEMESKVRPKHERRVRITVSLIVRTKKRATGRIFATTCTRVLYQSCTTSQRLKVVELKRGRNRVRWKLTMAERDPINSVTVTFFDLQSGAASATTHHVLRGKRI